MKNKKTYKVVVIGCGKIGAGERLYPKNIRPATHAAAYWDHPRIELAGLCDTDSKKLEMAGSIFTGTALYSSVKKMLNDVRPDIVSVATHPDTHFRLVKLAAGFGARAIICEKPISDSLASAKAMVKICREKKCFLFIAHLRHFDPLISRWQMRVKKGLLGKALSANCIYYNGFLNNGTHVIDLLRWFLGEVDKVSGSYNLKTSNPKKDKNIDAVLYFKNKSKVILQSLSEKDGLTEWVFHGKNGDLGIKKLGIEIDYKNVRMGKPRSLMAPMISHVISCMDGQKKPISTGRDGLAVLKVLSAVKRSAENKGKVVTL